MKNLNESLLETIDVIQEMELGAELEVMIAIGNQYAKIDMITEYAEDVDVEEFDIIQESVLFMEADDSKDDKADAKKSDAKSDDKSDDKKKKKKKGLGARIKKVFKFIKKCIEKAIDWIAHAAIEVAKKISKIFNHKKKKDDKEDSGKTKEKVKKVSEKAKKASKDIDKTIEQLEKEFSISLKPTSGVDDDIDAGMSDAKRERLEKVYKEKIQEMKKAIAAGIKKDVEKQDAQNNVRDIMFDIKKTLSKENIHAATAQVEDVLNGMNEVIDYVYKAKMGRERVRGHKYKMYKGAAPNNNAPDNNEAEASSKSSKKSDDVDIEFLAEEIDSLSKEFEEAVKQANSDDITERGAVLIRLRAIVFNISENLFKISEMTEAETTQNDYGLLYEIAKAEFNKRKSDKAFANAMGNLAKEVHFRNVGELISPHKYHYDPGETRSTVFRYTPFFTQRFAVRMSSLSEKPEEIISIGTQILHDKIYSFVTIKDEFDGDYMNTINTIRQDFVNLKGSMHTLQFSAEWHEWAENADVDGEKINAFLENKLSPAITNAINEMMAYMGFISTVCREYENRIGKTSSKSASNN